MADNKKKVHVEILLTPEPVRLTYANIHAMVPNKSGKMQYSTGLIIPKSARATVSAIVKAMKKVFEMEANKTFDGLTWEEIKKPLRDADKDRKKKDNPDYQNSFFLNASTTKEFEIIDIKGGKPITDPSEVYSGCWVQISLRLYPFDMGGNIGIGVGFGNIMKVRDDKALAGGVAAADEFSSFITKDVDDYAEDADDFSYLD